jgi:hypothetical protein
MVFISFRYRLAFLAKFCSSTKISDGLTQEAPNRGGTMRKTDLGPMLADEAPSANTLTDYDEEHPITIVVSSMPNARGPSGMKQLVWFSASIPYASQPEHAAPGKAISHPRNGWRSTAMVNFFVRCRTKVRF